MSPRAKPDRVATLKAEGSTKTATEWAEQFGVTPTAVKNMAWRHGLALKLADHPDAWPDDHIDTLKKLFAEGRSFGQIAKELNGLHRTVYSRSAVLGKARRLGLDRARGKASAPRLTGAAITKIRIARAAPKAIHYGVGKNGVRPKPSRGETFVDQTTIPRLRASKTRVYDLGEPRPLVDPEPAGGGVPLVGLKTRHCRWPLGVPGAADFGFCGAEMARGSYCADHGARAYAGVGTPPKDLARSLRRYA